MKCIIFLAVVLTIAVQLSEQQPDEAKDILTPKNVNTGVAEDLDRRGRRGVAEDLDRRGRRG